MLKTSSPIFKPPGKRIYLHGFERIRMNIREKLKTMIRVLKVSEKPDRESFMLSLKVFLIGLLVVGGLAFVIHLIASLLGGVPLPS